MIYPFDNETFEREQYVLTIFVYNICCYWLTSNLNIINLFAKDNTPVCDWICESVDNIPFQVVPSKIFLQDFPVILEIFILFYYFSEWIMTNDYRHFAIKVLFKWKTLNLQNYQPKHISLPKEIYFKLGPIDRSTHIKRISFCRFFIK